MTTTTAPSGLGRKVRPYRTHFFVGAMLVIAQLFTDFIFGQFLKDNDFTFSNQEALKLLEALSKQRK